MSTNKKVLIVDDDVSVLEMLAQKFTFSGWDSVTANSGSEGLETLKKNRADVILLDIMMPEMDGYEVLQALQGEEGLKDIPVIVLSNNDTEEDVAKSLALGAKEHFIKSQVDLNDIVQLADDVSQSS